MYHNYIENSAARALCLWNLRGWNEINYETYEEHILYAGRQCSAELFIFEKQECNIACFQVKTPHFNLNYKSAKNSAPSNGSL